MVILLIGCGNPFSEFYSGRTLTEIDGGRGNLAAPSPNPSVVTVSDVDQTARSYLEDGWVALGSSSWIGSNVGSEGDARAQARKIGASLVIWGYAYLGTNNTAVPITTPTTSTTYGSGMVYSPGGYGTWSGAATTYGTATTYVPIAVHRFRVDSVFLAKRAEPPLFGVFVHRITPQEQQASGTGIGATVEVVVRNSPAQSVGLLPGDVVQRIGIRQVVDEWTLTTAISDQAGKPVEIEWVRNGQSYKRTVTLNSAGSTDESRVVEVDFKAKDGDKKPALQPVAPGSQPPSQQLSASSALAAAATISAAVEIVDLAPGEGRQAVRGDEVEYRYICKLPDGTLIFDSDAADGKTRKRLAGADTKPAGLGAALIGAKAGMIRKATVPPEQAYGSRGNAKSKIPPNATLIFDIWVVSVNDPPMP